jgi:hypothetical protein
MSVYHQMGHDSTNLLQIQALDIFKGAIISPVNMTHEETYNLVNNWKGSKNFEFVFDPQLYNPRSSKGKLKNWFYFPQSENSMVLDTVQAWDNLISGLIDQVVNSIGVDGICTPIVKPKVFRDDYYSLAIQVGNNFAKICQEANANCKVYQTLIVDLDDLTQEKRAKEIASIVAGTRTQAIYLVINTNIAPRREIYDENGLLGIMQLIKLMESSDLPVLVSHCSSDLLLWKAAGATAFATGKFFNLRRFEISRWDALAEEGGNQLPYWFEQGTLAFLSEGDILRLKNLGLLGLGNSSNLFSESILNSIKQGSAWLSNSWRHWLKWFVDTEVQLEKGDIKAVKDMIDKAQKNWKYMGEQSVFLEQPKNDGAWLLPWSNAINKFEKL